MGRSRRSQRLALATGAASAAGLGLAIAVLWPGLERRWHLEALRRDPLRLEEMLLSEREAKRLAAREFVREPRGKEALFRLYLEEYDRSEPGLSTRQYLLRSRSAGFHGVMALWQDGMTCLTWDRPAAHSSFSLANAPENPRRREVVLGLIGACAGATYRLPDWMGLELQVVPVKDGEAIPPVGPAKGPMPGDLPAGATSLPPMVRHACFFRGTGGDS